jgi:hypothetical protein
MNTLSSPPITEGSVIQSCNTLMAEWLRGWFNGSMHSIGQNAPVFFPPVNIAFGQSDPIQPLYNVGAGIDSEIRVVLLPRSELQESYTSVLFAGKLVTDFVLFNFWVSAKHPGAAQSEYSAQLNADLLKAILTNPETRYPLVAGGINTIRPSAAQMIPSTDYHKRLVSASAQLQYPVLFDEQPTAPNFSTTTPWVWMQSIEFFGPNPVSTNDFLLGQYTAPVNMALQSANVIAWAPRGSPVVLQLVLGGVPQPGITLTIPVGAPNTEITTSVSLAGLNVPSGTQVRWQVMSAPATASSAWHLSLEMLGTPVLTV